MNPLVSFFIEHKVYKFCSYWFKKWYYDASCVSLYVLMLQCNSKNIFWKNINAARVFKILTHQNIKNDWQSLNTFLALCTVFISKYPKDKWGGEGQEAISKPCQISKMESVKIVNVKKPLTVFGKRSNLKSWLIF